MLRSVTLGLALSVLAGACALVEPLATVQPSRSFIEFLDSHGQQFVPVPVPATGVVAPEVVLQTLQRDGIPRLATDRTYDPPILGVVQCGPTRCRRDRGLIQEPGENVPVWIVGFPRAPGWAVVDARTGAFITGFWP